MRFFTQAISVFALAACVFAEAASETPKVDIDVTHLPSDCSEKSRDGDFIKVHYTGRLADGGKIFDSSLQRAPFSLMLGAGRVIKGWEEGLQNMCVHEKRTLTIPAALGYGARGQGSIIPGGATLIFDVELMDLDISRRPEPTARAGSDEL
ncbi:hypothetical protein HWV62_8309 [Athelia sp. TMB]|nr:hypothetical protein HWV62_25663 [Athelia sp. TMB]KAF7975893.1 hypothetical protein HWV62_8309 [Athelia sp. TMB]